MQTVEAIEIVLEDGTEESYWPDSINEAIKFLRRYRSRRGATVRFDPGGALREFFDSADGQSAVKQAIDYLSL